MKSTQCDYSFHELASQCFATIYVNRNVGPMATVKVEHLKLGELTHGRVVASKESDLTSWWCIFGIKVGSQLHWGILGHGPIGVRCGCVCVCVPTNFLNQRVVQ